MKRTPTMQEFNKCQNAREKKLLMFSSSTFDLDNNKKYIINKYNEPLLSATAKTFEQKILYKDEKARLLSPYHKKKML
jgi:hypothetical protein